MFPARVWRETPQRYRLEAVKDKKSGKVYFPPRLLDENGKEMQGEPYTLPNEGTIYSYTVIEVPPSQFKDEAPYAIGIVELIDGTRLTCQITDCELSWLAIGKKVKLEFRRIQADKAYGVLSYAYKAVPAE